MPFLKTVTFGGIEIDSIDELLNENSSKQQHSEFSLNLIDLILSQFEMALFPIIRIWVGMMISSISRLTK